ncbi:MAG TPA: prephenate dehydrogenase/arogenate dehydrogenase family protein [Dehalococcoidia bacterium]|nr:prephenate dehydrogenase/arogenate dehydrogenase family protein [Dehalococcoidia bacterium]
MSNGTETRRITIIGLGLIGASIGMRLKAAALPNIEIIGQDSDRGAEREAEKIGAIDRAEHDPRRAVEGASLVILATPIIALREVFAEIAPHLMEGAIVTDTASTKADVLRWAKELLPEHISFIGGHPMAGKETQGTANADPALFEGKAYCLCPTVDAAPGAITSVMGLAELLGAEPMFIEGDEHDVYAAAISHLPLVTATVLFNMMRASPSWEDLGLLASSGFRDMTRLASGDPVMSSAILRTNREAIIHWIERMTTELNKMRDLLNDSRDEDLLQLFATTQMQRDEFLTNPPRRQRRSVTPDVDSKETVMSMIVGGMMARNMKRIAEMPEAMEKKHEIITPEGEKKKISMADKMAEDIRRDLEKLEREREEKAQRKKD